MAFENWTVKQSTNFQSSKYQISPIFISLLYSYGLGIQVIDGNRALDYRTIKYGKKVMARNTDVWYLRHFVEIDNLNNRLVKVQYLDYLCIHSKQVQSFQLFILLIKNLNLVLSLF